jgi:hypothetical protein
MNSDTPKYYQPYDSDEDTDDLSDSGSDDDYDSDNLPDSEDARIRREEDPRYAIIRAAGPNFNTSAEQLKYMEHAPGSAYDNSTNITSLSSLTYLNPPKTTQTSLFTVKSINRYTDVYKSPFNFQLKTPRVYKNITKLQLVQISFPNNTTNFIDSPLFLEQFALELLNRGLNPDCLSTCASIAGCTPVSNSFAVIEKGRIADGYPKLYKFSIPPGQHSNEQIANSLNTTCNNTPPLNLISYDEFKEEFQTHRDISILFNEPGECFYSNITKQTYRNYTKLDVLNTYYTQIHIDSFPIITDKIAFNAYYYPILKEFIITNIAKPYINTSPYSYEQLYDIILGKFLGLNSDIYYNICFNNKGALDSFRKQLTFEHNPVNKYIWSYNSSSKRFSVIHNSLHPSLLNDITQKYNIYFNHELSVNNLTTRTFQGLKTQFSNFNSVFQELQSYLSTQLSMCFSIDNYNYTGGQLHNGLDAVADLHSDIDFTGMFSGLNQTFGKQFHSNFQGHKLQFTNFLDYHSTISSYYNTVITTSSVISSIHGTVNDNHHTYVSTKYSKILPYHTINTKSYNNSQGLPVSFVGNLLSYANGQSFTHPLVVAQSLADAPPGFITSEPTECEIECCKIIENILRAYYSCLDVNTIVNTLPYRLGINTLDFTNFNVVSSVLSVTSTSIFDIFMQLNTEQSFNNMDISGPENYAIGNETTGQVKLMAAKILMQGVGTGETSETAIQNPIVFETPLGKLDKLSFKLYLDNKPLTPLWQAYPFDPGFNEWNATFQIDEEVALADRNAGFGTNPTVPIPNNPSGFQYMALSAENNPLNK